MAAVAEREQFLAKRDAVTATVQRRIYAARESLLLRKIKTVILIKRDCGFVINMV